MNKKSIVFGIVLIIIGTISALSTLHLISGEIIPILFALIFLGAYFGVKRTVGFLIPSMVFAAVSVFILLDLDKADEYEGGGFMMLLLALAFLAIFLIHTLRTGNSWGEKYWPLFPSLGLALISGVFMAVQYGIFNFDLQYMNLINPIILFIAGFIIIYRGIKRQKKN